MKLLDMTSYTGKEGQTYYDMRAERRSDFVQARRARHFQPFILPSNHVLDFGCGTGGILGRLLCAEKVGIEVNPPSIREAEALGLIIHSDFSKLKDESFDVVISNHALEHILDPAAKIAEMHRVLKPGGRLILVVPAESPALPRFSKWAANDPDRHIYSWTPLSFGNLVTQCGFEVENSLRRPIGYSKVIEPLAKMNEALFQVARRIVALTLSRYEVACFARKPQ
jgi:SAM-dependent methyltransferase